jgi:lysozyme
MLRGLDVSSYQGAIAWPSVAAKLDCAYAFVKVIDGTLRDPEAIANLAGARDAGLIVGSYAVVRPSDASDPAAQARAHYGAVRAAGGLVAGDLPHAVDFEERGTLGDVALAQWLDRHVAEWERLMGRPPLLYTFPSFWKPLAAIDMPAVARTSLWWASYGADTGTVPEAFAPTSRIPLPWSSCRFWQYTDKGRLATGGAVDGDVFVGSLDELRAECLTGDVAAMNPLFVPPAPTPDPPDEVS